MTFFSQSAIDEPSHEDANIVELASTIISTPLKAGPTAALVIDGFGGWHVWKIKDRQSPVPSSNCKTLVVQPPKLLSYRVKRSQLLERPLRRQTHDNTLRN